VKDSGIGIPATILPQVFDLFMQADSSTDRTSSGLGIGLTLVRHLVELHRGHVEAQSAGPGQGSEFVVRLPALREAPPMAEPAGRPRSQDPSLVPRRILVVDDNADGAQASAILLRLDGHDVRTAHSGPETLEIATTFRPDVIFLDIAMPGIDGFETARRLRRMPSLDAALLVAVTGYGRESDRQQAREAGFDEFVLKTSTAQALRVLAQKTRSAAAATDQNAAS